MKIRAGYALLVPAFLVLFVGLIPLFDSTASLSPTFLGVLAGAAAVIALLFPRAWASDRNAAAMFLVAMLSLPFFVGGATVALMDGAAQVKGLAVALVTASALGFLGKVLWDERHLVDQVPHWLLAKFPREMIFEDDGVQWAIEHFGTDLARGAGAVVYLQNNIDAEREVTLRFRDESGFWLRSGQVVFPAIDPVSLAARTHAVVTVPLLPASDRALKLVRPYALVDAKGPAGPRNRGWRAPPGPRPLSRWLVVLGPFAGIFIWNRGGVFVNLMSSGGAASSVRPAAVDVTFLSPH